MKKKKGSIENVENPHVNVKYLIDQLHYYHHHRHHQNLVVYLCKVIACVNACMYVFVCVCVCVCV